MTKEQRTSGLLKYIEEMLLDGHEISYQENRDENTYLLSITLKIGDVSISCDPNICGYGSKVEEKIFYKNADISEFVSRKFDLSKTLYETYLYKQEVCKNNDLKEFDEVISFTLRAEKFKN